LRTAPPLTPPHLNRRKVVAIVLGVCLFILLLALLALNAFNSVRLLSPNTTGQIFLFTALSAVAFLLFVVLLVLLVRNVLKLYAEQRSRVLGARLRTRMLWGAVLLSLVPISFMFGFSYLLMNRAMDRWFSQPATKLREYSTEVALELSRYIAANARAESSGIAAAVSSPKGTLIPDPADIQEELEQHEVTLQGGFVMIFSGGQQVAQFHRPTGSTNATIRSWIPRYRPDDVLGQTSGSDQHERASGPIDRILLDAVRRTDEPVVTLGNTDYSIGSTWVREGGLVVVALPLPAGMSATIAQLQHADDEYWTLFHLRTQIRTTYMLLMLMITSLALFASTWLALYLSKQVTRPVETLADAMEEIAQGHYDHRVAETATEELGELVHSFNLMAADLDQSRRQVEQSTLQVYEANAAIDRRRHELETMLQTIPNGVVMLDAQQRIVVVNRAFSEMLDPGGRRPFIGSLLREVLPGDASEPVERLLQRSHRMGTASSEMEMQSPNGTLNIAATASILESGIGSERKATGYVLVLENATQLLRAQKQSAWKEVARRVAHEIKNPLTPISLSAEQIRRHIGRLRDLLHQAELSSPSVDVIHRSSEVISSSVESMRSLVDQFSSLAEFPNARPRPSDLNQIVRQSLSLFAGRLQGTEVVCKLAPELPLVMADPEAFKRALSNLIDNAAEAMQGSLVREIHVVTSLADDAGMVSLSVADTGPGVTNEMRDRLFLPYFSTKQRGTGLGLTIAAKIVQDHQGSIRVEKNVPTGAKFIIDVPVAQAYPAVDASDVVHATGEEKA
jgi:two-component system, NtrC family, nitrogen regulation sensor histidine kinase NtrY